MAPKDRHAPTAPWQRRYTAWLAAVDSVAVCSALLAAALTRFGADALDPAAVEGRWHGSAAALIAVSWLFALFTTGSYQAQVLGSGVEEYKRLVRASFLTFGVVAIASYAVRAPLSRGFVAGALPLGLSMLMIGRFVSRRWLVRQRLRGRAQHRVLAVGSDAAAEHLDLQLRREPAAGYRVVANYSLTARAEVMGDPDHGRLDAPTLAEAARAAGADMVAVTSSAVLHPQHLREISWELERTGIRLMVVPGLIDVRSPRISVCPVGGLPLLHVELPVFTGMTRVVKNLIDRCAAGVLLILLAPLLLALAFAVRSTSPGPALFRQGRIGTEGKPFRLYKLRTMYDDAEHRREALLALNNAHGPLFKIHRDPRVTPLGRFLRKYSLDELPQLINVLRGEMSLVGPRPPLPREVAEYRREVHRRLLVKPGMTGLWQVSGRSALSWEDTVRLDLYYVENWSIALDFVILMRTVSAVIRGSGAF